MATEYSKRSLTFIIYRPNLKRKSGFEGKEELSAHLFPRSTSARVYSIVITFHLLLNEDVLVFFFLVFFDPYKILKILPPGALIIKLSNITFMPGDILGTQTKIKFSSKQWQINW